MLSLRLSPDGVAEVGPLPPGRRVVVEVRVLGPSEQSCEIRLFVNLDRATAKTPVDDPHFAGTVGVFGLGISFDRLPAESPMRKERSVKEHRIDITRVLDRVAPRRDAITLKVVGVNLEDEPLDVRALPIESMAIDVE